MRWWTLTALMVVELVYSASQLATATGKKIGDIYWNSTNPIFLLDNTNHVFNVRLMDSVDIICPRYDTSVQKDLVEYSVIHMVNKLGYDMCKLDSWSIPIAYCRTPYTETALITIVFREFTPSPNGLEFKPDHDYYFISTSTGSQTGIFNREGGLCETKNMKLRFDVKHKDFVIDSPQPVPDYKKKRPWQQPMTPPPLFRPPTTTKPDYYDDYDDVLDNRENVNPKFQPAQSGSVDPLDKDGTKHGARPFSASKSPSIDKPVWPAWWDRSNGYFYATPPANQQTKPKSSAALVMSTRWVVLFTFVYCLVVLFR